jgi:tRNA threonylcarbamoyladenosine biosynthesis protein TsaE
LKVSNPKSVIKELSFSKEVNASDQTQHIASQFAKDLHQGDTVAFYGELGSGKTYMIKTICKALGVRQEATSPSFTIINEYHSRKGVFVYHFDFYRLENPAELQNLGLDELFYGDFICLVEWADKIEPFLPSKRWEVYLEFIKNHPNSRRVSIYKVS